MRQHKLALCAQDFLTWFVKQTERTIHRDALFEQGSNVLVAVSGGKDSLALWHVLQQLGYPCNGLYIGLGIDDGSAYSDRSRACAQQFADQHGMNLKVVDVAASHGATIPEAAQVTRRGAGKPCSVCGLTRRYLMNRAALEGGYDVLVTGHNLDDEAATLMGNTMNWLVGYLESQAPLLPEKPGFVRKAKPFHRFYERETAAYALLRGIDYIQEECPYSADAKSIYYKKVLNQIETDRPGAKQAFYLSFLQARDQIQFTGSGERGPLPDARCSTCGQPTRGGRQCAFCSTWQNVRARNKPLEPGR
ncbi:MAG: ATP-binding protein [Anaerolineales bacterium]|nr:ATP-binding protein [Anaerolineales bacterium]